MSKKTILIVHNDEGIRETLRDIWEDEGCRTFTASSGEATLNLVDTEQIDLVLMNIWMQEMDSLEILKGIKDLKRAVPVIMITSYSNRDKAVHAVKLGAYGYIQSPLSLDELLDLVKSAINTSKSLN